MLTNNFIQKDSYLYQENSIGSIYQQQSPQTMASSRIRSNPLIQITATDIIKSKWLGFLEKMIYDLSLFNDKLLEDERQIPDCSSLKKWKDYDQSHQKYKQMCKKDLLLCLDEVQSKLGYEHIMGVKLKQIMLLMQSNQSKISTKISILIQQKPKSYYKKGRKFIITQEMNNTIIQNAQINKKQRKLKNASVLKSKKKYDQEYQRRKNVSSLSKPKNKNDQKYKYLKNVSKQKKKCCPQEKNSKYPNYLSKPKKQNGQQNKKQKNITITKAKKKNNNLTSAQHPQKNLNKNSIITFKTDPDFQFYENL